MLAPILRQIQTTPTERHKIMKSYISHFILIIGSIFTMTACEREPTSENEKTLKIVREHQAKEKKSFNNPEPITGFEHTVTFNLMGTKLVVPYGYLTRYSKDNATKWFSDTEGQDGYFNNFVTISAHYKKTEQGWVLEPYNQHNKAHFIKMLKDGLASVDDIVIRKKTCTLDSNIGVRLLAMGSKQIPSAYLEYDVYEDRRAIPENPYIHEIKYVRKGENPVIITQRNNRWKQSNEDNYGASISFCIDSFTVHVYPFSQEKQQLTQQELVGYQQQVEQLVQSFLISPNQ